MFAAISLESAAISVAARPISSVVADCCSTAAAITVWVSWISRITVAIWVIAVTASWVSLWMACTRAAISSVAPAVLRASSFTSFATTAKPLPASPARAASIVALSASRLVCSAIDVMTPTTSPILAELAPSRLTVPVVASAISTAELATRAASTVFRAISWMLALSSSPAAETDWIEPDTCSAATDTVAACAAVSLADELSWWLTVLSSSDDADSECEPCEIAWTVVANRSSAWLSARPTCPTSSSARSASRTARSPSATRPSTRTAVASGPETDRVITVASTADRMRASSAPAISGPGLIRRGGRGGGTVVGVLLGGLRQVASGAGHHQEGRVRLPGGELSGASARYRVGGPEAGDDLLVERLVLLVRRRQLAQPLLGVRDELHGRDLVQQALELRGGLRERHPARTCRGGVRVAEGRLQCVRRLPAVEVGGEVRQLGQRLRELAVGDELPLVRLLHRQLDQRDSHGEAHQRDRGREGHAEPHTQPGVPDPAHRTLRTHAWWCQCVPRLPTDVYDVRGPGASS